MFCWWNCAVHPECFSSDCLQCKDCCYSLYPLMCSTSKTCMDSCLANRGIPVLLVYKRWNVNLSLYMPGRHIEGTDVELHLFLTSALDGGESSASYPRCFTPKTFSVSVTLSSLWLSIHAGDWGDSGWCSQSWSVPPDSCIKCSGWIILCPLKPRRAGTSTHICSRPGWVVFFASSSTCGKCSKG